MTTTTVQAAYTEHLLAVLSQIMAAMAAPGEPLPELKRLRADTLAALHESQASRAEPDQPWGGCR